MSPEVKGYLNDLKDTIQDELKDNDTRKTISEATGEFLTTGISSTVRRIKECIFIWHINRIRLTWGRAREEV